ncbi:SDR family NAD(P)-dependent oxidoreductase [Streptomyces roseoverticillatus]|uniref:SDR family NAD(P)-dependent oxidoreductase n=1 Tax=Streptomyces roseoverticillatus TaxID=66429 RepID=UPI00341113E7
MSNQPLPGRVPVAIVGLGALLPDARDLEQSWRLILGRRDPMQDIPPTRWLIDDYYHPVPGTPEKVYTRRGAFVPAVDFDPLAYGIPPHTLASTDTAQLLALLVADRVLQDAAAGRDAARPSGDRVAVILGSSALGLLTDSTARTQRPVWLKALREHGLPEAEAQAVCDRIAAHYLDPSEDVFPGLLSNVVAGRIAAHFDLHGTNHTADAACASSLAALSTALDELSLGRADLVISGGVDVTNDIGMFCCFTATPALSPTQVCRPFSEEADGTMLGEAVVMFALKRLADAERDGDGIYAVVRGLGTSSDGRGAAIYNPRAQGQVLALRRAYDEAGYAPGTVELVEAHGTGTSAGDQAELTALREVYEAAGRDGGQWCALGSVKSQIGHTKSAAGAAGLLKAVLALHHKVLPPTLHAERPHPALRAGTSPFYLNTSTRPWVHTGGGTPRRAAVSSFGFGGSNFHVTLEEHRPSGDVRDGRGDRPRLRTAPTELFLLSADSGDELGERIEQLRRAVDADDGAGTEHGLAALARSSQNGYRPGAVRRLAVIAADAPALAGQLDRAAEALRAGDRSSTPPALYFGAGPAAPGRVGFLFPGQGSQYTGMGGDLAVHHPAALAAWDAHGGAGHDGTPLHRVVFPPPAPREQHAAQQDLLTATEWAQPAVAAHSLALLALLDEFGLRPDCVAGHSLGELTALHAAGAYDAETLMHLARRRGEAMRDAAAATPGAMLVVRAGERDTRAALDEWGVPDVWIANVNGPRQTVVSGTAEAVATVADRMAAAGVGTVRPATSAAFHSPLIAAAAGPFAEALAAAAVTTPGLTVFCNTDAVPYADDPALIRDRLVRQLTGPVRFTDQVEAMYEAGVRTFAEVGPGSVLTGLVSRILGDRPHLAVPLDRRGTHGVTALQEALARLAVHGIALDFAPSWRHYAMPRQEEKKRRRSMAVRIDGGNLGRRYPPQAADAHRAALPARPDASARVGAIAGFRGAGQPGVPAAGAAASGVRVPSGEPGVPGESGAPAVSEAPMPPAAHVPPAPPVPLPLPAPPGSAAVPAPDGYGHPAPPAGPDGRLAEIEEAQRQTADAHAVYLRSVSEAHMAFLKMSETSFAALVGSPGTVPPVPWRSGDGVLPGPGGESVPSPFPLAPAPAPVAGPVPEALPVPVGEPGPGQPPVEFDASRLEEVLLEVVAERTGYPVDMLDLDMELESELGIDSIKRVEILSLLRQRVGEPPDFQGDPAELASFRTLRQIIDRLRSAADGALPILPQPQEPGPVRPALTAGPATPVVGRYVLRTVPVPPGGLGMAGLGEHTMHVVDGGSGLAALVAERLEARGVPAEAVAGTPPESRAVLLLGGLAEGLARDAMLDVQREVFTAARLLAPRFAEAGGVFVTVQDTGGDFGAGGTHGERAWLGGPAALVRTLAAEWPKAVLKAVDCARSGRSPEEVADAVVAELLEGGPLLEAGLPPDGSRVTTVPVPAVLASAAGPDDNGPGPDDVLVVTGGARGVTAAAVTALARARRPHLALLGRTVLDDEPPELPSDTDEPALVRALAERNPGRTPAALGQEARRILAVREIRATLAAIEEAGAPVRYFPADIRDPDAVRSALDSVRAAWGPVTGIVHGAGVLADKRIADKTDEQFDAVFGTKTAGLCTLLDATAEDPLRTISLFSSVAGCFGNPGQSDYAMANETLGHVAAVEAAARPGCRVRAQAWGPWAGGMVTPALADHFASAGVPLLSLPAGAQAFVDEVTRPGADSRVLLTAVPAPGGAPDEHPAVLSSTGLRYPQPAQVRITPETHPQLADHVIHGRAALPLALTLDRLLAAARNWHPGADAVTLRDVRVMQPVSWDEREPQDAVLTLTGASATGMAGLLEASGSLSMEVRGAGGRLHCTARAEAGAETEAGPPPAPDPGLPPWGQKEIYDGHLLFHGPMLHALREVEGVGPTGARGSLAGLTALGWPGDTWQTDPAVLDGALQLAALWAREAVGQAAFPMAVGTFRPHHRGPARGPVTCTVLPVRASDLLPVCHLRLVCHDGTPFADLLDVELIRRPDKPLVPGNGDGNRDGDSGGRDAGAV